MADLHKMLGQAQELFEQSKRHKACDLILENLSLMFKPYSPERLKEIDTFLDEIDTEKISTYLGAEDDFPESLAIVQSNRLFQTGRNNNSSPGTRSGR